MAAVCSRCRQRPPQEGQRWCRQCRTEGMRATRARAKDLNRARRQRAKKPCTRCGALRKPERLKQVGWVKPFMPRLLCGLCRRELFDGYLGNDVKQTPADRSIRSIRFRDR